MIWVIYPAVILSVASEDLEHSEHLYTLRNGRKMPVMGFRVPETPELLSWAFRLGYRMTETSHRSASQAMRETQLPRAEFFVSTQISSHGFDEAHRAIRQSLRQLRLDYVDLLLLAPWEGKLIETWDSMVEMNKMGLVRSLGVRDFDIHHLETLASHGRPLPEVLQLELHPFNLHKRLELIQWCKAHHIQIQATGSLALLENAAVSLASISEKTGMNTAQILLRWALQMGFQVMPRSTQREHLERNFHTSNFKKLTPEEMNQVSELEGHVGLHPLNAPLHLGDTTRQNRSEVRVHLDELSAELWV